MSGAFIFAYFVLPFVVGGMGFAAYYLHARQSDAELRARAAAERSKG
jgi:hypothetical protein